MIIDADGVKHTFSNSSTTKIPLDKSLRLKMQKSGLEFWFDFGEHSFRTSREDLFLFQYQFIKPGVFGQLFVLHIDGRAISFSSDKGKLGWSSGAERRKDGSRFWLISDIGAPFRHKDKDRARTHYSLTNSSKFASQEQQDTALDFITSVLSKYLGSPLAATRGDIADADVLFDKNTLRKLDFGDFIDE